MYLAMLTVTELANRSGTTPHAVRYYTRKGLLRPERDPNNGYRLYDPSDVSSLRFIRKAKALGYTLNEIHEIMHDAGKGESPCPRVRELIQKRIVDTRRQLNELRDLQDRMENALKQWKKMPDGVPNGHSICHLIESFTSADPESSNPKRRLL